MQMGGRANGDDPAMGLGGRAGRSAASAAAGGRAAIAAVLMTLMVTVKAGWRRLELTVMTAMAETGKCGTGERETNRASK